MTAITDIEDKVFQPGTTGWTAGDLDDPEIDREWERGAYEIVEGVLATMPPAYLDSSAPLENLIFEVKLHLRQQGLKGEFAPEVDLIIAPKRVARVDAVFLTEEQLRRQQEVNAQRPARRKLKYGRLRIPPTLIIESVSLGHESHDRETKRAWYAEFGVPHYWLLDAQKHSLECLVLSNCDYQVDVSGKNADEMRPSAFPGLVLALGKIWV